MKLVLCVLMHTVYRSVTINQSNYRSYMQNNGAKQQYSDTQHFPTCDFLLLQLTTYNKRPIIYDRTSCQWPLRSSKVDNFYVIWLPICHFLLVINRNLGSISHRLVTIARNGFQHHARSIRKSNLEQCLIWQGVWYFLLVIHSNLGRISRRFRDIAGFSLKKRAFFQPPSIQPRIWKCFSCNK